MTALAYVASEKKRVFVVAPKKVLDQWVDEAVTAFPEYFDGFTCKLGAHIKPEDEERLEEQLRASRLVCVNYEQLGRFFPLVLRAAEMDTIILDESHYIKNPKANRTKLLQQHRQYFDHRLLLSGTPIKNNTEEFASQLEFLDFDDPFKIVESEPGRFWNALVEKGTYIRRSIQHELPHLQFNDIEVIEAKDAPESLHLNHDAVEIRGSKDELLIREMIEEQLFQTAQFKAPFTASLAQSLIEEFVDDKVIVMTERIECARTIFSSLRELGLVTDALLHHGKKSHEERASVLEAFWETGPDSPRILVSTRPSIGIGLNLQVANRVIFNDLAWTPADILQASARTKRLNQRKEVHEYWMLADTQFDQTLVQILRRKRHLIRLYGEGKNISDEDHKWMTKRVSYREILLGPNHAESKPTSNEHQGTKNVQNYSAVFGK